MWRTSRPDDAIERSRSAVTGGIRWRTTPHARECSARKRRLSSSPSPCHSCAVTGRSPSTAARQSPVSSTVWSTCAVTAACSSSRVPIRVMPGGGGTAGVVGRRCTPGTRSCRDTECSVRSGRSAEMARSTMVRPVPTSSRSPSGSSWVHGSPTRRGEPASVSGAQAVPGREPVARTTARATIDCPPERRTTNRSPRRSMPRADSCRRSRRALPGYSAAVVSRPAT